MNRERLREAIGKALRAAAKMHEFSDPPDDKVSVHWRIEKERLSFGVSFSKGGVKVSTKRPDEPSLTIRWTSGRDFVGQVLDGRKAAKVVIEGDRAILRFAGSFWDSFAEAFLDTAFFTPLGKKGKLDRVISRG